MRFIKAMLIIAGTVSLFLGMLGILIPGLPTTPFLLLTAYLYARGSERLYNLLISNRILGSYITEYRTRKGMTWSVKLRAIGLTWAMISVSVIFFISSLPVKIVVILLGLAGTVIMGFVVPTYKDPTRTASVNTRWRTPTECSAD